MRESLYEVRVPDSLNQYGFSKKDIQRRFVEWLVFSLFTEGRVSSGKSAQLLGISRVEFLELLRKRGVAYINFTPEELSEEFTASKSLKTKRAK